MIKQLKRWISYILIDRYGLVRYPTVKIKGKHFIINDSGLQCPYCLMMQNVNRTVQNSLKNPNGLLIGYWLHDLDEEHSESCKQK